MGQVEKFVSAYNSNVNSIRGAYLCGISHISYMDQVMALRRFHSIRMCGVLIKKCKNCGMVYISHEEGELCEECGNSKILEDDAPVGVEKYCRACGKKFIDCSSNRRGVYCPDCRMARRKDRDRKYREAKKAMKEQGRRKRNA